MSLNHEFILCVHIETRKCYRFRVTVRRYRRPRSAASLDTEGRVLAAAEALIHEGKFHAATVTDLAARAGVARATVFQRFQSKLGVLLALATRCSGGPELRAVRDAFGVKDARAAVPAVVAASCDFWERQGFILVTLKAIAALEPGAIALIDSQRAEQSGACAALARRLHRENALRPELSAAVAGCTLHMLTSAEAFLELRGHGGLSLEQTRATLSALTQSLLR
jgi:AcrR family transcriptional regulator